MEWQDDQFLPRRPHSLPSLHIKVQILEEAHAAFSHPVSPEKCASIRQHAGVSALADSGAQTCACGLDVLHELGLEERHLIPTSHRIMGVTGTAMDISGVFLAKLTSGAGSTRQLIYVSKNTTGFYLSCQALRELGSLPSSFPTPARDDSIIASASCDTAPCGCPQRSTPPPKPTKIPFEPIEENVHQLEAWILDYYKASGFNTCAHQQLPCMTGTPLQIHFKPDSSPKAYHTPIPVPHHWKAQVKADLDRDVRLGIIEAVPPGTPTVWCSRMVVVPKKDGSPRRTVDLQPLNAATYRATHHTPSPFNQASLVPPNTRKTVLDAWNGYHSLRLSPQVRDATTFITEWGRYRYLRAPQGFHAAGDGYTKCFDDITVDVERKTKCIDDTILWDQDIEHSFWHTVDYITLCSQNGIVFNPKKFQFAKSQVDFAGFTISESGLKPTQGIMDAIQNFPKPKNITDARSWFGLVNQVAYNISTSAMMQPFRDLLKPGQWYWDENLDRAFEDSKQAILNMIKDGVRSFEPNRPTCLATDWSKQGIGFTLLQKHCNCPMTDAPNCCHGGWHLILAGSRFTTDAESRYAPIEGEALAVTYGLEKCRMFTLGCQDLTIATDHKPLVKILGDTALDTIKNPRLFNLKEKTLLYKYTIKHVPGAWHQAPDACSRRPNENPDFSLSTFCASIRSPATDTDSALSLATNSYTESIVRATLAASSKEDGLQAITLDRIKEAAGRDQEYIELTRLIQDGFPQSISSLKENLQPYWKVRDGLSSIDGVILYDGRVIIPSALRPEVLECLHSAHQGVVGMKARARNSVYWPGLSNAITNRRAQCRTCNTIAPSQPAEPLAHTPAPAYPFELTVADYFALKGFTYLVYADRYTGWVTITKCHPHGTNATALKQKLRTLFCIYGAPAELATDGGQPFASHDIQQFLKDWGVRWRLSSAYYAQSNGRAELAVKTAKRILQENTSASGDLQTDRTARALLQYRNTPIQHLDVSPAQMLYGRTLRDHLPSLPDVLQIRPEWQLLAEDRERAFKKRHIRDMERYNEHTKPLPGLSVGESVAVQNQTGTHPNRWDKTGVITEVRDNNQYTVRLDGSGRCTLRNRKFLRRILPVCMDKPLGPWLDNMPAQPPSTSNRDPRHPVPTATDMPAPVATPTEDVATHKEDDTSREDLVTPASSAEDVPTLAPPPALPSEPTPPAPSTATSTTPQSPPATPAPRRSTRIRRKPRELTIRLRGQRHDYS